MIAGMRAIILVAACAVCVSGASATEKPTVVSSTGIVLAMPKIDDLDCSERSDILNEYLVSGYRESAPLGPGHPDRIIFEYENRLSQAYFMECAPGKTARDLQTMAPAAMSN